MHTLPDPLPNGLCCRCERKPAVTRDGRFCKTCLRHIVRELTPDDERTLARRGTDQIGRPARSTAMLGGAADVKPN